MSTVTNVTTGAETFTCNAYLLTGDSPVLIDAGAMSGVVDVVAERTDRLSAVVLTHQHADHVERLDAVLDAFDADLWAHGSHPRRTRTLADGDHIQLGDDSYEVVHTPGHADDHIALVGAERVFSGDVVVYADGAFDGGSFGRTDLPGQSRDRLIASLETLLERLPETVDQLYPGHGPSYDGDIHAVITKALARARRHDPKYPE